jgi:hypothetical protein
MGRTLVCFFLSAAFGIAADAQTATTTSTQSAPATNVTIVTPSGNAPVTSGSLPLPAPPETALPGSGTPVGTAPDVDVNNAAQGGSGAVTQPGAVVVGNEAIVNAPPQVATPSATPMNVPGPGTSPEATPGAESVPTASQATEPATPVVRRVYVGSANVNAPAQPKSLGELSKQIRGNKPLAKRTFDNSDIMALSEKSPNGLRPQSEDLPQGDQPATATTPQQKGKKPSAATPPRADNGALDQKDLAAVEAAVKKNKDKQNTEQPK